LLVGTFFTAFWTGLEGSGLDIYIGIKIDLYSSYLSSYSIELMFDKL
jgi:hypothetical protein